MTKYTIAICDILGFSNLVQEKPLEEVVKVYLNQLKKALGHSIFKEGWPLEPPSLPELQDQSILGIAWFSDTILLYTLEDKDESLKALISTLGWLLFETMHTTGIRLRCAVSYGEMCIDAENSIYVGKPLIEAHRLEQAQAWSGGALTAEAAERLPEVARSCRYPEWWLVHYAVPLQGGKTKKMFAINWTIGTYPDHVLVWSDSDATPSQEECECRPDVCEKWKNTKAFLDQVRRHGGN